MEVYQSRFRAENTFGVSRRRQLVKNWVLTKLLEWLKNKLEKEPPGKRPAKHKTELPAAL